jgi:hypothetical protein
MTFTPRIPAKPVLALAAALAAAGGATAAATTGGAGYGTVPAGQVGDAALHAPSAAIAGGPIHFAGTVSPNATVRIQRLDARQGWTTAVTTRAGARGRYVAAWRGAQFGHVRFRAVGGAGRARSAASTSSVRLTVFRPSRATWYGPGFYGHRTACGQKLTRTLVGVANRTLPCGTKVTLFYRGRTVQVPVVDRGPYGTGANWDITAAAAQQLGFTGSDRIGVLGPHPPGA